jgi:nucleotidyltransferase/DNA polymerase involved in DNA repair
MKIAHLFIPHLPVQVERRKREVDEGLGSKGLIIGGRPWDPSTVLDCCAVAEAAGVAPGMSLARAALRCPEGDFLSADHTAYKESQQEILVALHRFTDLVETAGMGSFFIEVGQLSRRFPKDDVLASEIVDAVREVSGLDLQLGLAEARFTAEQAALAARINTAVIVPPDRGRHFLSSLPIHMLPADAEILRRLDLLGIHTLGEFAALPRAATIRQFGVTAGFLHDLAAGVDPRPVARDAPPLELCHQITFEPPTVHLQSLLAAAQQMAEKLGDTLHRQGYQAQGLRVEIASTAETPPYDEHQIINATSVEPPTSDPERLVRRTQVIIERTHLAHPVGNLRIVVYPLRPAYLGTTQLTLFSASRDHRWRSLQETLRRLRVRFGEAIVKIASLLQSPEPRPIQVTTHLNSTPVTFIWQERVYSVRRIYEHWQERRLWWSRPITLDFYRLEDSAGNVRLVYLDLTTDTWWLDRRRTV